MKLEGMFMVSDEGLSIAAMHRIVRKLGLRE